jgi:F-type H+-transporting ATPase subunit epsilon
MVSHIFGPKTRPVLSVFPGHADFLTALAVSVVTWRDQHGVEHYVAVRGGMLEVRDGEAIIVATREAVLSDDLHHLETEVLAAFHRRLEEDQAARSRAALPCGDPANLLSQIRTAPAIPSAMTRFDRPSQ